MGYKEVIEEYEISEENDRFIIGAMANEINNLRKALTEIQDLPNCDSYMARTIARKAYNHGS